MEISFYRVRNIVVTIFLTANLCSCSSSDPATKPQLYTVEIKDMKFIPAELTINKGDTVLWTNRDIMAHDVTEEANGAWTSSKLEQGSSWSSIISQSAEYYCSIHLVMKGRLIVK